jgi:hypothetical protein
MANFLNWLITSSADPNKLSLAVKGFLLGIAPIAMLLFGLTQTDFGTLVDTVVNLVFWITSGIAAIQVLFGILRKVKLGRWSASE